MVVSRLPRVDKKVTYVLSSTYVAPFPYYYSFYGYLGAVYPVVYDPGYTREDTTVRVETNVYTTSKPDGDLVWTGVSDSFNPKSAKSRTKDNPCPYLTLANAMPSSSAGTDEKM